MALINAFTDYFSPTGRHEAAGGDWREVRDPDAEYQRRIATPGWKFDEGDAEDLPRVVKMQPARDPFNPRKVHEQIPRLSVEISGLQNQIDELEREKADKIERRRELRLELIKEADRLGCFQEIEDKSPAGQDID
jgi:hypothetical protein